MFFHIIASIAVITRFDIVPGQAQTSGGVQPLTAEQVRALKPTDSFKECDKCLLSYPGAAIQP
jgi:hypothetical protein